MSYRRSKSLRADSISRRCWDLGSKSRAAFDKNFCAPASITLSNKDCVCCWIRRIKSSAAISNLIVVAAQLLKSGANRDIFVPTSSLSHKTMGKGKLSA